MVNLEVLRYPDGRLHLKAKPIEHVDDQIRQLAKDMAETMYNSNGIGLAATQVNVQKRMFVIDLSESEQPRNLQVFINPQITERNGQVASEEGCLSVPGIYETIKRSEQITVTFKDLLGEEKALSCDGLLAICIQHEIDHLDGKVFVEYLSTLKQNFIKKKLKKSLRPL